LGFEQLKKQKYINMIFIVATPIGNLRDITLRALDVLKDVDFIISEDTRETIKLLNNFQICKPLLSYYKGCEKRKSEEIISLLKTGKNAALVCDRGTPGISDPAHYLVRRCFEEGVDVVPVPGPSSLTAAISVSGFPVDCFSFYGFLPKNKKKKLEFFKMIENRKEILIFFESVHRFDETLEIMNQIFPERRLVVCRELTKKFEEIVAGSVSQLYNKFIKTEVKGEFVIVLGGKQ